MINPPSNFQYSITGNSVSWDAVPEAIEYEISHTPQGKDDWRIINSAGELSQILFSEPSGNYELRGKTKSSGGWGIMGPIEVVTVPEKTIVI